MDPFLPLLFVCRMLSAALCKNKHFTFFVPYGDHTYEVSGTGTRYFCSYSYHSKQQFAAGTPIVLLYEKGDVVIIEPRPPSPNTCRLCARSSRTRF